jgi:DNA polymerase III delta prime subunit
MNREILEKYQPKLTRLFTNSRKSNRLSGAYLLYGPKNAPLKETALYLAQSLGCEKELLACNECNSCKRFLEGIRPDFVLIDGQSDMIKKGDIQALEKKFSLSAYEKGHSLCYVINKVDNINNEAANALLKFLEEPKVGQVAFLTTNNPDKVLATIRSRSISVRVDPIEPLVFQQELEEHEFVMEEEGKKKTKTLHLSSIQAYILARNYATMEEVEALLNSDTGVKEGIDAAEAFLNDYCSSYKTASFTLLKETALLKDTKCYNWMYLTILDVFESVLLNDKNDHNPFSDVIHDLRKHQEEIRKGVEVIKEVLTHKNLNYNATLTAARFLHALDEEN